MPCVREREVEPADGEIDPVASELDRPATDGEVQRDIGMRDLNAASLGISQRMATDGSQESTRALCRGRARRLSTS